MLVGNPTIKGDDKIVYLPNILKLLYTIKTKKSIENNKKIKIGEKNIC